MNSNKVVSIITPSFNRSDVIEETANSIFAQTYPHWEWVIVDDGSTDNSLALIEQYVAKDKRVKYFHRDREPKGAAVCRNIAIENCTGDYLLFLDTDDILASFCLEQRIKAAKENDEADFIIFPMLMFKKKPDDTKILWNTENGMDDTLRVIYGDPICQGTGTLWKKSSFVDIGLWDESLALWQDIELHLRALLSGLKYTKRLDLTPDIFIRLSETSLSRTGFYSALKIKSRVKVLSKGLALAQEYNKLDSYRIGFKNMAKNIYISAAYSKQLSIADFVSIAKLTNTYSLFSKKEQLLFKAYFISRIIKLYHLPFLNKSLEKKINGIAPAPQITLNKTPYLKEVQL